MLWKGWENPQADLLLQLPSVRLCVLKEWCDRPWWLSRWHSDLVWDCCSTADGRQWGAVASEQQLYRQSLLLQKLECVHVSLKVNKPIHCFTQHVPLCIMKTESTDVESFPDFIEDYFSVMGKILLLKMLFIFPPYFFLNKSGHYSTVGAMVVLCCSIYYGLVLWVKSFKVESE